MLKLAALSLCASLLVAVPAGASRPPDATVPAPVATHPAHDVRLSGAGGGTLSLPGFAGDRVRFRLTASVPPDRPLDVHGRFRVEHVSADGRLLARFSGAFDCLMTGGGVAVATGLITSGSAPGLPGEPEIVGRRIGLTVADRGPHDRLGWSWLVMGFHDVAGCTGIAPFFPVTRGGFAVRGDTDLAEEAR
ncbi:hypothetical protein SAMN04487968_10752 [Nocardioides terrae]|uniref:MspA protein n=1 Tax=Nocardioides terrae TaxID=574651 RepID=A0A1I1JKP6_9ACTN|nr:hypothetical protein [Nocardioides terrae]SFC49124.1 hypothetical protein SAMN04487968_10752 [Nocardioides terrae]